MEIYSRPGGAQGAGCRSGGGTSLMKDTGRRRRDKAGLVRAAVMFATEDHATTCRKGGIE